MFSTFLQTLVYYPDYRKSCNRLTSLAYAYLTAKHELIFFVDLNEIQEMREKLLWGQQSPCEKSHFKS